VPHQEVVTKLPWRRPEAPTRLPAGTQISWYQNLYGQESRQLAQAGVSIGPLNFSTVPEANVAPTAADLAETDEVQLTPAIQAKALALGRNPVAIHNWVRNNIEFAPTWGPSRARRTRWTKSAATPWTRPAWKLPCSGPRAFQRATSSAPSR